MIVIQPVPLQQNEILVDDQAEAAHPEPEPDGAENAKKMGPHGAEDRQGADAEDAAGAPALLEEPDVAILLRMLLLHPVFRIDSTVVRWVRPLK